LVVSRKITARQEPVPILPEQVFLLLNLRRTRKVLFKQRKIEMVISPYTISKKLSEYKIIKAKERWNKCFKNLTQEQILEYGKKGYSYDQIYDQVLDKERGKDEDTDTNRSE
jgi:hypothetical protein